MRDTSMTTARPGILITGGGTFMGNHIAAALLAEHQTVSVLIRPATVDRLGPLAQEVTWHEGDVWNPASLKGRARRARIVIHTVGGTQNDPATGLTYHYLNVLSLRNVVDMCISDGVQHLIFISAANAPWFPQPYIRSKREAEAYLKRVGLNSTVIRAPLLYQRGKPRHLAYRLVNLTAMITPFFRRSAPLPIDIFARGVARVAISGGGTKPRYYASDLKRLNNREERRGQPTISKVETTPPDEEDTRPNRT
jgi:uncharacterized protein YbjT (DUF2867 family)